MVSSWAPVQWLRRGWRAHGHNRAASVIQAPVSLRQQFRSAGSARGPTLPSRGRCKVRFSPFGPPLMSNVRRRMAATEATGRTNASGASCRTVASTVARLAVLVATRYGRSVPHGREPTGSALSSPRRAVLPNWKAGAGCPSSTRVVSARSCLLVRSGAFQRPVGERGARAH